MLPIHINNVLEVEDEEHLAAIRERNIQRRRLRDNSNPFEMPEQYFIDLFRLNREMAHYVFDIIQNNMRNTQSPIAVPPILRFLASLNFFATGSYQRAVGESFNVTMSQQCVSRAILEVSSAIENMGLEWIHFPTEINAINRVKTRFMEGTRFPGVIGAIDCTHIALLAPNEEEHAYINRKGFHSKNVQLICDHDLNILNVNARYPGSCHDSFIWRNSQVQTVLQDMYENGVTNTWLVGDSGYPQQPWLMVPILNATEGTPEYRYTQRHIIARNCIERCIGLPKMWFRCLLRERILRYNPIKVGTIINACCILHNVCIRAGVEFNFGILNEEVQQNQGGHDMQNVNEGIAVRRQLIERYFS